MRKQPALLDDVADSAAQVQNARRRDRISFELDRPAIGLEQADDQSKQSRLAATAWTNEHCGLAALEIQVRRLKRWSAAERFVDPCQLNQDAQIISKPLPCEVWLVYLRLIRTPPTGRWLPHGEIKDTKQLRVV